MGRRSSPYNTRHGSRNETEKPNPEGHVSMIISSCSSISKSTPPPRSASRFKLPEGWIVEKRPSKSIPGRKDNYYYEPGTRRQFKSLLSVERYFNGETYAERSKTQKCFEPSNGEHHARSKTQKRFEPHVENNMQIIPSCSRDGLEFNLPDGWVVEKRQRGNNPRVIDMYYYEPRTGCKLRSLVSVQRYLNGEATYEQAHKRGNSRPSIKKRLQPCYLKRASNLPDGWVVEEKPRKNGNCSGVIDRNYIEPGTGKHFRSMVSAIRYLTGQDESTAVPKSVRLKDLYNNCCREIVMGLRTEHGRDVAVIKPSVNSGVRKKRTFFKENASSFELSSPPKKVRWVLNSLGRNIWNPFINNTEVVDAEKQLWSDTFICILNGRD